MIFRLLAHFRNQQSVRSDILLGDREQILPIIHHFGRRQIDPILHDHLVFLPLEPELLGVSCGYFGMWSRVDPPPLLESSSFGQIEAVLRDVPQLRLSAAVVRHRPLPVAGSDAEPGFNSQPQVVGVFPTYLDGVTLPAVWPDVGHSAAEERRVLLIRRYLGKVVVVLRIQKVRVKFVYGAAAPSKFQNQIHRNFMSYVIIG